MNACATNAPRQVVTGSILSVCPAWRAVLVAITAGIVGAVGNTSKSLAEVSGTDRFTPRSWDTGNVPVAARPKVKRSAVGGRPKETRMQRRASRTSQSNHRKRLAALTPIATRGVITDANPQTPAVLPAMPPLGPPQPPSQVDPAAATEQAGAKLEMGPPDVAVQVTSLGPVVPDLKTTPPPSLTKPNVAWRAKSTCLATNLQSVIDVLATNFGAVTVNSTCRSVRHNRRVGGARRSWHLTGNAVDFRIHGTPIQGVISHLRGWIGGLKHYGGGRFHIDNGPRRRF